MLFHEFGQKSIDDKERQFGVFRFEPYLQVVRLSYPIDFQFLHQTFVIVTIGFCEALVRFERLWFRVERGVVQIGFQLHYHVLKLILRQIEIVFIRRPEWFFGQAICEEVMSEKFVGQYFYDIPRLHFFDQTAEGTFNLVFLDKWVIP